MFLKSPAFFLLVIFYIFVNVIDTIVKYQNKWIAVALSYCQDIDTAKDIVQEMYIKVLELNKEVNHSYISLIIRSIAIDGKRKDKLVFTDQMEKVELIDEEYTEPESFDCIATNLTFLEREIFVNATLKGQRQYSRETTIPLNTVHRITKHTQKKLWQNVKRKSQD